MPKVKIVAVAKDEAPFFPLWVYHHFYFGFNAIDIYINRTSDNSEDVLDNLSLVFPKLSYFHINSLDYLNSIYESNTPLQLQAYGLAYENEKDYDYLLFIDIDVGYQMTKENLFKIASKILIIPIWLHSGGLM